MALALHAQLPTQHELQVAKSSINVLQWAAMHKTEFIAAGRRKSPGPDHGGDPNDEKHDPGLPGNAHAGDGYPSDDPYNDSTDNNKNHPNKPY